MRKFKPFTRLLGCLIGGQLLLTITGYSQDVFAYTASKSNHANKINQQDKNAGKQTLFNVLKELNKTKGVYFLFSEKDMAGMQVNTVKNQQAPVEKQLDEVLDNTGLRYKKVSDNTFVILKTKEKVKSGSIYTEPDFEDEYADNE